jgi:hypothetical protein
LFLKDVSLPFTTDKTREEESERRASSGRRSGEKDRPRDELKGSESRGVQEAEEERVKAEARAKGSERRSGTEDLKTIYD